LAHIFKPIPKPKNRGALKSMHEQEMATTLMERDSIVEAVKRFQSRRKNDNLLSNRHTLQRDDFVMKKRTSFHQSIAKKYQNQRLLVIYKVINRVATNSYKIQNITDPTEILYVPGDNLIQLHGYSNEDCDELLLHLKECEQTYDSVTEPTRTIPKANLEYLES
jgi:hypothetical protein